MQHFFSETLEPRRLFAGVTILTHGFNGSIQGWADLAARGIVDRAGGNSSASIYSLRVGKDGSGNLKVLSYNRDSGFSDPRTTKSGEIVVKLDWSTVSDGSVPTGDVANVVSSFIRSKPAGGEVRLAELPIHLIGFSRGGSLMTALARSLGRAGIWVDQQTNLDPHPVDGINENDPGIFDFGDTRMATFDNVAFADTYWRSDGHGIISDFDGEPVAGSHNSNLTMVQQNPVGSAHSAVMGYYYGTINTKAGNSGDVPFSSAWYGSGGSKPARDQTGYLFSRIVGGARPGDGLWSASGGSASRSAAGKSGSQWANIGDVRVMGGNTFAAGQSVKVRHIRQDRDSSASLVLFIDRDTNPYNNNFARTARKAGIASSDAVTAGRINAGTGGVDPGRYYVCARITDSSGHMRFAYSKRITLTAASQTRAIVRGEPHTNTQIQPVPWGRDRIRLDELGVKS